MRSGNRPDFKNKQCGATSIEYALIAALVSVVAIGALTAMGGSLSDIFDIFGTSTSELCDANHVNYDRAACMAEGGTPTTRD